MDATLAERRYLGLSPAAGLERTLRLLEQVADVGGTVAILWHTDRFSREYARGWDRVYDSVLEWVGRPRRAAGHGRRSGRTGLARAAVRAAAPAARRRGRGAARRPGAAPSVAGVAVGTGAGAERRRGASISPTSRDRGGA